MDREEPGGGDEGHGEGDGGAEEEQGVKHGEHYQQGAERSLAN